MSSNLELKNYIDQQRKAGLNENEIIDILLKQSNWTEIDLLPYFNISTFQKNKLPLPKKNFFQRFWVLLFIQILLVLMYLFGNFSLSQGGLSFFTGLLLLIFNLVVLFFPFYFFIIIINYNKKYILLLFVIISIISGVFFHTKTKQVFYRSGSSASIPCIVNTPDECLKSNEISLKKANYIRKISILNNTLLFSIIINLFFASIIFYKKKYISKYYHYLILFISIISFLYYLYYIYKAISYVPGS